MLPNIPPKLFSLSAIVVGYILIDDMTANEQNALGNWLMLVAQVLSTNAFYRNVMQERGLEPRESTESEKNNNKKIYLILGLIVCTAYLVASTYNPFLYFRF